jgi:hypothetical protein
MSSGWCGSTISRAFSAKNGAFLSVKVLVLRVELLRASAMTD